MVLVALALMKMDNAIESKVARNETAKHNIIAYYQQ